MFLDPIEKEMLEECYFVEEYVKFTKLIKNEILVALVII